MSFITIFPLIKSMAQEFETYSIQDIIFNYPKRPSKKSMVIGIPMLEYRIQTNDFKSGLNFFQKAILKFKSRPGFPDELIAEYLGIDVKLVCAIKNELVAEKLLDGNGALTEQGREQKASMDGLIINNNKKKIGYIFRYLNEDKFYPYYVSSYRMPNVTSDNEPKINGLKGDDFTYNVYYAKEMLDNILNTVRPDEKKVFELIKHNDGRTMGEDHDDELPNVCSRLSVKFIPDDKPSLVWVCTYAYLEEKGNEMYGSDWKVLDPFSEEPEDSTSLKLYVQFNAPELTKKIEENFADVQTIEKKIFKDANFQMEKQVEYIILKDFPLPQKVDKKFYSYLKTIVRTKLAQEYHNYSDEAPAREFSLAFQQLFESLLKQHREKFPNEYNQMLVDFSSGVDSEANNRLRKNVMKKIFRKLFNKQVPYDIYSSAGGRLDAPKALRGHLVATILTRMYTDQFYRLILKYHDNINDLCNVRNYRGHGHTDQERVNELLTKEQVEGYYRFLKSFIYEYTNL